MKRRTKIATILTAGLLSASLVGVGFAAWTIASEEKDDKTTTGAVSVLEVQEGDLTMTVSHTGDIKFGAPTAEALGKWEAGDGATYKDKVWLTYDEGDTESLVVTITIKFTKGTLNKLQVKLNTDISALDTYIDGPTYAIVSEGTTADTFTNIAGTSGEVTLKDNKPLKIEAETTLIVTATFSWDTSTFGGKNPYFYYNEQEKTTAGETAKTTLESFHTAATNISSYKFSVIAS